MCGLKFYTNYLIKPHEFNVFIINNMTHFKVPNYAKRVFLFYCKLSTAPYKRVHKYVDMKV